MKRFLILVTAFALCAETTLQATLQTARPVGTSSYSGYCNGNPDCGCDNVPMQEDCLPPPCDTYPCQPFDPYDPCAPVCGAECGISLCALGVGLAAAAVAAALILFSSNGSTSGHP